MRISDWSSDVCSSDLQALQPDGQARGVHHGEHRHQALVGLADHPALRVVEVEHAGRRPVDAHLVFERPAAHAVAFARSEEHTSELQSLMRISYAVFCLKKKKKKKKKSDNTC